MVSSLYIALVIALVKTRTYPHYYCRLGRSPTNYQNTYFVQLQQSTAPLSKHCWAESNQLPTQLVGLRPIMFAKTHILCNSSAIHGTIVKTLLGGVQPTAWGQNTYFVQLQQSTAPLSKHYWVGSWLDSAQ